VWIRKEMIMMNERYTWVFDPPKKKVPDNTKRSVKERCDRFLDSTLRQKFINEQDATIRNMKVVALYTKWRGNFFYFKAKFESNHPDAISPFIEEGFARLEYVDEERFNLSYFRHTGKWWEVHGGLTLDECLDIISGHQLFQP